MEKSKKSHSSHSPAKESGQNRAMHQRRSHSRSRPPESHRSCSSRHRSHSRSRHSRGPYRKGLVIPVPIALAPTPHKHVNILREDILPTDLRMSKLQTC